MLRNNFFFVLSVALPALLVGCSSDTDSMIELQDFVNSTVNRPPGAIEPLPEFISYEAFTYSAASLRGPFDEPVAFAAIVPEENDQVKPDESRIKEELEAFSIASLKMVGSLSRRGTLWVLIQDESSEIHRVEVGSYLGRNHGQIIAASDTQIDVLEIVPSGSGGWIERPLVISIEQ